MSKTKALGVNSGVDRRVTITGWDINIQIGQPLTKISLGCRLLVELVDNSMVVSSQATGFNINGSDLAGFVNAVQARRAALISGGVPVPAAEFRAYRRELYERIPASIIAADGVVTNDSE